jgi:integrase
MLVDGPAGRRLGVKPSKHSTTITNIWMCAVEKPPLSATVADTTLVPATPPFTGKGPCLKRRYQEGLLKAENGYWYSFFRRDVAQPDGSTQSKLARIKLGKSGKDGLSELAARREHGRLREQINRERGSVPPATKGESFRNIAELYMTNVAPHLSISTVRQRNSHLNHHLLPRFGNEALMSLNVKTLQMFATDMLATNADKGIVNVLGTLFRVLDYAKRTGIRVPDTKMKDLTLRSNRDTKEAAYFKPADAQRIIAAAKEPYRTIFTLAWGSGLRAGELLGLTINDIDFERKLILPRRQADDRTRQLRELKTKKSQSPVAMTAAVEAALRDHMTRIQPNPLGLLFPSRTGKPRKRGYVIKFGLAPVLKKLGLPKAGLHAFRHGLGTALANSKVSPKLVQSILRHADLQTTFRYYVHADADAQREALQALQSSA